MTVTEMWPFLLALVIGLLPFLLAIPGAVKDWFCPPRPDRRVRFVMYRDGVHGGWILEASNPDGTRSGWYPGRVEDPYAGKLQWHERDACAFLACCGDKYAN